MKHNLHVYNNILMFVAQLPLNGRNSFFFFLLSLHLHILSLHFLFPYFSVSCGVLAHETLKGISSQWSCICDGDLCHSVITGTQYEHGILTHCHHYMMKLCHPQPHSRNVWPCGHIWTVTWLTFYTFRFNEDNGFAPKT